MPIRSDYFVSDLAAAIKLPVLVVAQNRLGCLNHAALTVRSVAAHELKCVGRVLNSTETTSDIAALTNADILGHSRRSVAPWPRRKPDGTSRGLATYA